MTDQKTKTKDFVEIKFTGYANNQPFDSNIEADLKQINPEAKPEKTIIIIGQGMVVPGLDKALEDKELNKEYETEFNYKEGFGPRDRNLMRTIPLKAFTEQKVNPYPGLILTLDNAIVKIIAVSGARVTADFNNPLAGKDLKYKFTITKIVEDKKEKADTVFKLLFKFAPEFEVKENKVHVKLPKGLESMIDNVKDKFKDLLGLDLVFEEKKEEKKEELQNKENHDDSKKPEKSD